MFALFPFALHGEWCKNSDIMMVLKWLMESCKRVLEWCEYNEKRSCKDFV